MAITQEQFHIELDACKTYMRAGNYPAARVEYAAASMTLAGLNSLMRDGDGRQLELDYAALQNVKIALDVAEASSGKSTDTKRLISTRTAHV